jgi:DNA-binding NtrC family response regulator
MKKFDVLLVDDEERFLETTSRLLARKGYTVSVASGGADALEILESCSIQVAILDVRMPGIGGIQVLKMIKREYPLVEVIMLTGHATVDAAVDGLKFGAADYLMKPADIDELKLKIDEALEKRALIMQKISLAQSHQQ